MLLSNTNANKKSVLGLGSPLMDVHAEVDSRFLSRHGLTSNNATVAGTKQAKLFEEMEGFHLEFQPGGCVTNTLRVLRWICKTSAVTYLGAVGCDRYARLIKQRLKSEKVDFLFEDIEGELTGKCAVLMNGKNRSLCTDLAASNCYTINHLLQPHVLKLIQNSDYIYMSAFFLGVSPECVTFMTDACLKGNKHFVFNLGAPFVCQKYKQQLKDLIGYVDLLFGNESEARALAVAYEIAEHDLGAIINRINNLEKRNVSRSRITIITRGAQSILVGHDGQVEEFPSGELTEEKVIDTNAAGDGFVGGFLSQFIHGRPLSECIKCAVWAATEIIQNIGCNFNSELDYDNCHRTD